MAFTLSQLEALEKAAASGQLSVRHGDKVVTYQSLDQMQRLIDRMRAELGITTSSRATSHRVNPYSSKGL